MASSRSAAARSTRSRPRQRPAQFTRPRVVRGAASRGAGIRWDRAGRIALLVVLVGMAGLYAGPARSYVAARHEAAQRRADVAELRRENERLRARRAALRRPQAVEREARRLGMVRPGEKPYVIEHLPRDP